MTRHEISDKLQPELNTLADHIIRRRASPNISVQESNVTLVGIQRPASAWAELIVFWQWILKDQSATRRRFTFGADIVVARPQPGIWVIVVSSFVIFLAFVLWLCFEKS
jgi:hypothetical protein